MSKKNQILVTDWTKKEFNKGTFLILTLSSEQRRILRGKRISECNHELYLQLPRCGTLNDGDILLTNYAEFFVKVIAKKEHLLKITAESELELIKAASWK